MDFGKLKSLFQKSNDCLEQWLTLQEAADRLLANSGNILQRLPVLSDYKNFGSFGPSAAEVQQLTLAKQVKALEAVFGRLQANMQCSEEVVRSQERYAMEAWKVLGDSPSPSVCNTVQAGGVTIAQLVECMEDVWRCCRDDLASRGAALACLTHTSTPDHFAAVQAALAGCTGLHAAHPSVVFMTSVAAALR